MTTEPNTKFWIALPDWLRERGVTAPPPSLAAEARRLLKDAFAEGRMVAGTSCADKDRQTGCAIGQIRSDAFGTLSPTMIPWSVQHALVAANNFECIGKELNPGRDPTLGRSPGRVNIGQPLKTIDPLLRVIDIWESL